MPTPKNRPLTPEEAPDPARVYERARPEAEAGMGSLTNEKSPAATGRDKMFDAIRNRHESRQLNSEDVVDASASKSAILGKPAASSPARARRKSRHKK